MAKANFDRGNKRLTSRSLALRVTEHHRQHTHQKTAQNASRARQRHTKERMMKYKLSRPMLSHSRSEGTVVKLAMVTSALLLTVPVFGQVVLTTAQIAKRVSPSVVVIQGKGPSGDVLGSGFIVSKDGKIVTNLHVIRDLKTASVQLANGEIFDSISVLATDQRRDLAVLQVAGFNLPVLTLGNSEALTVGEPLVVVGSPRGLDGTVTGNPEFDPGQRGGIQSFANGCGCQSRGEWGPLLNNKGQAVGVVSFKLHSAGPEFCPSD